MSTLARSIVARVVRKDPDAHASQQPQTSRSVLFLYNCLNRTFWNLDCPTIASRSRLLREVIEELAFRQRGRRYSVAQSRKKIPSAVETQFLHDMRAIVERISELTVNDAKRRDSPESTLTALLQLALSMESTFAVWCQRHVHLERVSSDPTIRGTLKRRADAAMEDADRIAERLHQITGSTEFRVNWLPSASEPMSLERWTLSGAVRDEIAADRLALEGYGKLISYVEEHDAATAAILEAIVRARRRRLRLDTGRALAS
jgi:bacterioferritin (cytochrome b1)